MAAVTRLVTLVDVRVADARQMSFSARHEAVLSDGRRVLLADRGWSTSAVLPKDPHATGREGEHGILEGASVKNITETARFVVGPDEPVSGRSQEDAEADHWAHLVRVLRQQWVMVDVSDLKALPHEVVLTERLLTLVRS